MVMTDRWKLVITYSRKREDAESSGSVKARLHACKRTHLIVAAASIVLKYVVRSYNNNDNI